MSKQQILGMCALLMLSPLTSAEVLDGLFVAPGENTFISDADTLTGSASVTGTLINYGMIKDAQLTIIGPRTPARLINHSGMLLTSKASIGSNGTLTNSPAGQIVTTDAIELISNTNSNLINSGRITVIKGTSNNTPEFFTFSRGTFQNMGVLTLDRPTGENICGLIYSPGRFVNRGRFEISKETRCDFPLGFEQLGGELQVNGYFVFGIGATIDGGTLSGSGLIVGDFTYQSLTGVDLAPGAPVGTLNIEPSNSSALMSCDGCSVSIEIDRGSADRLTVVGDLSLSNWTLNVRLRGQSIPEVGKTYTIITANDINESNATFNLPTLPNGRNWDVNNTGGAVVLTAN